MKVNIAFLLLFYLFFVSFAHGQTCPQVVTACDPATGTTTTNTFIPIDMAAAVEQPDAVVGDYFGPEIWVSNAGCDNLGNAIDVKITVEQKTTTVPESYLWGTGADTLYFKGGGDAWYEFNIYFYEAGTTTPISLNILQEVTDIDGDCDFDNDGVYDIPECDNPLMLDKDGDYVNVVGYDWYYLNNPTLIYQYPVGSGNFVSAGINNGEGYSAVTGVAGTDMSNISAVFAWKDRSSIMYNFYTGSFKGTYLDLSASLTVTDDCLLLPVTFSNFSTTKKGNDVLVEWTTGPESNGMEFDIEYSSDGINFEKLGSTSCKGTPQNGHSYSYLHQGAALLNFETLYYRIKFLEYSGAMSQTAIKSVHFKNNGNSAIGFDVIEKLVMFRGKGFDHVEVYDISGHSIKEQKLNSDSDQNFLDVSDLNSGIYIVKSGQKTSKIIIE